MDAPPMSSERKRELAELRSRAYGPDADIDRDVDAQARLIELEELARADAPEQAADADLGRERKVSKAAPAASSATADGSATALLLDESGETDQPQNPPTRRPWWRRVPLWAYILGAVAVGLGIGIAIPVLVPPHPATTLHPAPLDGATLDFEMYGIQAKSPVRFQPFHNLEVWSAQTDQGSACIVVTTDSGEWMAAGCAPEPLNATADINFYAGMRPINGLELPDGSVLRFILHGDVMEVWIAQTVEGA